MDPTSAGNAAAASHTVGGRPVNTSGGRGHCPKKNHLFVRDARQFVTVVLKHACTIHRFYVLQLDVDVMAILSWSI
jgi:hypothetical protein